jgi:rubredoxin
MQQVPSIVFTILPHSLACNTLNSVHMWQMRFIQGPRWHCRYCGYATGGTNRRSISGKGKRLCASSKLPEGFWDPPKPPVYSVRGGGDSLLKVKWPVHEADHSLESRVKVKNKWNYTPNYRECPHVVQRYKFASYTAFRYTNCIFLQLYAFLLI